jgi:diacylglycerol kinase family enzyme
VAFYLSILLTLLRYRPRRMQLTLADGEVISGDFSACVANGRYFGSGLGIAPMARLDDGLLEVVMIKRWRAGLAPSAQLAQGAAGAGRAGALLSVRSLLVEGHCPLEVDGELVGQAPARFTLEPAAALPVRPVRQNQPFSRASSFSATSSDDAGFWPVIRPSSRTNTPQSGPFS